MKNGGKLVIPAGTRIVATAGAASYLLVEQGGQLYANGTAFSPVSCRSRVRTQQKIQRTFFMWCR
ncbi:hypothetical protein [Chryseobacterium gossypii]|uniref:hypothetical protein n=1 Tax=Chryseobacterium gossypii TaxID=3231602 RepID=UPI0035237334